MPLESGITTMVIKLYTRLQVALIIGNQSYWESTFGDIVHAEDDARDISAALKSMNFKVG